ncbi:unnamed protein product, partial [Staurois parvus]
CTFLTLSDREESTAENRQLSERGSAPIIRALMISALLCPAVHPPVPLCSATYLCPEVPPTCAQQCHPPVPTSATSATHLCPPTSAAHQCHPPVQPSSAASQ